MAESYKVTPYGDSEFLSMIKSRRARIDSLLNKASPESNPNEKLSENNEKTDKSKTPFERLVSKIKTSDLSIDEKKSQIHYVKYALAFMDEDQSKKFEEQTKTLINLKEQNKNRHYDSIGKISGNIYSAEIEKALKKLQDLEEQIKQEKEDIENRASEQYPEKTDDINSFETKIRNILKSVEQKLPETLDDLNHSYSSRIIDEYVEKLNEDFSGLMENQHKI